MATDPFRAGEGTALDPGTLKDLSARLLFICAAKAIAAFSFLDKPVILGFSPSSSDPFRLTFFFAGPLPPPPPAPPPPPLDPPTVATAASAASTAPPPFAVPRPFLLAAPPVRRGTWENSSSAKGSYVRFFLAVEGEADWVKAALAAWRSFRRWAAACSSSFLRF